VIEQAKRMELEFRLTTSGEGHTRGTSGAGVDRKRTHLDKSRSTQQPEGKKSNYVIHSQQSVKPNQSDVHSFSTNHSNRASFIRPVLGQA
jgi:hypothetical protein